MKNRHKIGFLSMFLIATMGQIGQAQATFYDLHSGMLKKNGEKFVLSKCGIVPADFILIFENNKLEKRLPDLTTNRLVQLQVKATAQEMDGQHYLMVHDISNISTESSCNLLDFLE